MGLNFDYSHGQTPLDEDEKEGLLIQTIATRYELDEFEQQNIEEALQWVLNKALKPETIFSEKFLCNLHKRMFGNVWRWAGKFRKTNKNLGIESWKIPVALKTLCDDALFWIQNNSFTPDEIAIRFKHRLVSIHCFSNGNGRHSRLIADIIIHDVYNLPLFTWGTEDLKQQKYMRNNYLKAIKNADKDDYKDLLTFARS